MAQVILIGATIGVGDLTDEQVASAIEHAIESDNHAAQNVDEGHDTDRAWFAQYCDLHETMFGRLVAI